ncbi:pyridoxamine 5'-phosphate oxidase [Gallibacterium salpingitidis]|uniref:heme utilization protein HutZ n=1 Tax=Gallibacterium salpingitidis TaxID=505341 RepID=UPI000805411C|nr:heme utilization protein HutZ [Gallibacterium salpingitidis]OBX04878.1 pyridoxamine 5'-phosphate oxidase [Gallibacterium salpingitidis]
MKMEDRQTRLQDRIGPEIQELKQKCKTLMLATVDAEGVPNVSYAPFALSETGYHILISDIARHARNLKQTGKVSVMLIEDEQEARKIFARRRLSFNAEVKIVPFESEEWFSGTKALQERHGDIVGELTQMADFTLFNLVPGEGLFVKGFGQAYKVGTEDTVGMVHLDQGHQKRN